jgi:hypothetical protein
LCHNPPVLRSANPLPGRNQGVSIPGLLPVIVDSYFPLVIQHFISKSRWKQFTQKEKKAS